MDIYLTSFKKINAFGEIKTYAGPDVPGISFKDAQDYCNNNGLSHCQVDGLLIAEIPYKEGTYEPDWDNEVNYEIETLN